MIFYFINLMQRLKSSSHHSYNLEGRADNTYKPTPPKKSAAARGAFGRWYFK